jgi:uncharacterized membrane protein
MPIQWTTTDLASGKPEAFSMRAFDDAGGAPKPATLHLRLSPNRSLPREGFVTFIGVTCALIGLPMLGLLGTPALWWVLLFFCIVVWGVWYALQRNNAERGRLHEDLTLTADRLLLVRHNPRGPVQNWEANPYWLQLNLKKSGGPVENYITLNGAGRAVELGSFLSPDERDQVFAELSLAIARMR